MRPHLIANSYGFSPRNNQQIFEEAIRNLKIAGVATIGLTLTFNN
jgi:hypothetical protein